MVGCLASRMVVVSGDLSAASARGALTKAAAPANERLVRNRRRVCIFNMRSAQSLAHTFSSRLSSLRAPPGARRPMVASGRGPRLCWGYRPHRRRRRKHSANGHAPPSSPPRAKVGRDGNAGDPKPTRLKW